MPSYTIYSELGGGYLETADSVWDDARTGAGAQNLYDNATYSVSNSGKLLVGSVYLSQQAAVEFDTSVIPDDAAVVSVSLTLNSAATRSMSSNIEARGVNWGPTLAVGDWVYPWTSETLLASYGLSGGWTEDSSYTLTSQPTFKSYISKTGTTYFMIGTSDMHGIAPAGVETPTFHSVSEAGTTKDPKLEITTTEDPDFTPTIMWIG